MSKGTQRERDPYFVWRGSLTADAMHEKARSGELPGSAPVGYRNQRTPSGTTVAIDGEAAALIRELFELAASTDLPIRKLQGRMTEKGLRSRSGRPVGVSSLYCILTNRFYYGVIEYQRTFYPGRHEPIITSDLFDQVHKKLQGRRRCVRKTPLIGSRL